MAALAPRRRRASSPTCPTTSPRRCWSAGSRPSPGRRWYESLTLMFQREVAERIVAGPGSKTYGRLGVLAGWRSEAEILFDVSPRAFTPPPKVTSSVVRLMPRAEPLACDPAGAGAGDGRGLRPAAQDAAPEPEDARPRRAAPAGRPASTDTGGRRRSTSPASSRWPTPCGRRPSRRPADSATRAPRSPAVGLRQPARSTVALSRPVATDRRFSRSAARIERRRRRLLSRSRLTRT